MTIPLGSQDRFLTMLKSVLMQMETIVVDSFKLHFKSGALDQTAVLQVKLGVLAVLGLMTNTPGPP